MSFEDFLKLTHIEKMNCLVSQRKFDGKFYFEIYENKDKYKIEEVEETLGMIAWLTCDVELLLLILDNENEFIKESCYRNKLFIKDELEERGIN